MAANPNARDIKLNSMDSLKNCCISSFLLDPTTFLTPTSLARIEDLAVERFMKLMQAISSMMILITEKMTMYVRLPLASNSPFRSEFRWISVIGCR